MFTITIILAYLACIGFGIALYQWDKTQKKLSRAIKVIDSIIDALEDGIDPSHIVQMAWDAEHRNEDGTLKSPAGDRPEDHFRDDELGKRPLN